MTSAPAPGPTDPLVPVPDGSVSAPRGFTAGAAHAGLKADGALDVALLVSAASCATAGVFTKNALRAAPVIYDADLLSERPGRIRAVAMNARVANACTGPEGLAAARAMAEAAEQAAGLPPRTALVLSTGVIGVPLPIAQIAEGLREAAGRLGPDGGNDAARAIMTTDTRPKHCAVRFETPSGWITVGGIAKGSGMIHPDMATLLAVLTTDAAGEPATLQPLLRGVGRGPGARRCALEGVRAGGGAGGPHARPRHRRRRGGRLEAGRDPGGGSGERGGGARSGPRHRPLGAREDRHLRGRPQLGAHPRGRGRGGRRARGRAPHPASGRRRRLAHARRARCHRASRPGSRPRRLPAKDHPPPHRPRPGSRGGGGVDLRSDTRLRADQRRLHVVAHGFAWLVSLAVGLAARLACRFPVAFFPCVIDLLTCFDVSAGAWPCIGEGCWAATIAGAARRASVRSVRRIMRVCLQREGGPPWSASAGRPLSKPGGHDCGRAVSGVTR